MKTIDLHTHTLFSDGELVVSELLRRAEIAGYGIIGITDHADSSNLDFIVPRVAKACRTLNLTNTIKAVPGIEITHAPVNLIRELVKEARDLGAGLVVVHGESPVEPVAPGTNRAGIEARCDILAHPGLISEEDVALAALNGVALEISGRQGHSFTNGHVASLARKKGARLVICSDAHSPGDLMTPEFVRMVALGAGLGEEDLKRAVDTSREIAERWEGLKR